MGTNQSTVSYILEQIAKAGAVTTRKMFGEYALYCDGKVVGLICDDELFIKISPAGEAFLGNCPLKPPFRGATAWFFISGDKWDDEEWLSHLIRVSAANLPLPKIKCKSKSKARARADRL